jgi:protein O-GlcNAcase/histone acetyltransferase
MMDCHTHSNADDVIKDVEEMEKEHDGGGDGAKTVIGEEELLLLADVFYLPHEHGPWGLKILGEFNWLKMNANLANEARRFESMRNGGVPDMIVRPEVSAQVVPHKLCSSLLALSRCSL